MEGGLIGRLIGRASIRRKSGMRVRGKVRMLLRLGRIGIFRINLFRALYSAKNIQRPMYDEFIIYINVQTKKILYGYPD